MYYQLLFDATTDPTTNKQIWLLDHQEHVYTYIYILN
jgi:hypothetical protein